MRRRRVKFKNRDLGGQSKRISYWFDLEISSRTTNSILNSKGNDYSVKSFLLKVNFCLQLDFGHNSHFSHHTHIMSHVKLVEYSML